MTHRSRLFALACLLVLASACRSGPVAVTPSPTPSQTASATPQDCVQRTMAGLSTPQRIGQLIFLGLIGNQLGSAERSAIESNAVGSVWYSDFSTAPAASVAQVSAQVQALSPTATAHIGFLIGANQEGGQIDQFRGPGFRPIPSALQQGTEDPAALQTDAALWAAQLKAAGINLDLAPVMDTVPAGQDASNAPIGALQREFGHDPATVSSHGLAFIAGMHQSNVLVTIKHFPGLGRVAGNTDFSAAVVDHTTTTDDPYLVPFAQAINAGADLVMVSTATYTQIDAQHLAVFSPAIIGLLRHELHFGGVVVSDDLGAAAAVASIPAGDRAVHFVAAGGDLITVKNADLVAPMTTAIANRVKSDPVFAGQVDGAVTRVLQLKVRASLVSCGTA
jgi:beta-N-acetylhexosaminidase